MGFDLYFYKRNDNPLTEDDFANYLTHNLPFNVSDTAGQWVYENQETGVYFVIERNEFDDEDEMDKFEGFTYLNLTFSLNFFRPDFFALESFPIVEKIVNDLDLFIFDLQDFGENPVPSIFPANYLRDEWIAHNKLVSSNHFDDYSLKYMPLEKSNYLWQFQSQREELQNSLTEDIYVAGILVVEGKEDKKLYTVSVWPKHIPIILPKVDYVIIKKEYKSFFKNIAESGLVSYDTIISVLGKSFESFEHPVPDLNVLTQKAADSIGKKFNALKIECTAIEFGKMVGMDKFVNVRP